MIHSILKSLAEIGVNVSVAGDRLRLAGNLSSLTEEMKADLQSEKASLLAVLGSPYPNSDGLSKCVYCLSFREHRCTQGHQSDGVSLLRECGDFRFDRQAHDYFYEQVEGSSRRQEMSMRRKPNK